MEECKLQRLLCAPPLATQYSRVRATCSAAKNRIVLGPTENAIAVQGMVCAINGESSAGREICSEIQALRHDPSARFGLNGANERQ